MVGPKMWGSGHILQNWRFFGKNAQKLKAPGRGTFGRFLAI